MSLAGFSLAGFSLVAFSLAGFSLAAFSMLEEAVPPVQPEVKGLRSACGLE